MEKQDKLNMHTSNIADANFSVLAKMFPNAVTETVDENGEVIRTIDADVLAQEINTRVVSGKEERYQFTWPDKKKSVLLANAPIAATLRPSREESVDFDDTENLYIEGDNLDVLKLLRETYLNRVKMVYIDPPYNTGNDFIYEDDFDEDIDEFLRRDDQFDQQGNRLTTNIDSNGRFHTDWLNMIYPRLRLAKDLLIDEGVVFVSIDDNELENLLKICDEIFGAKNHQATISYVRKTSGKQDSTNFMKSTEFIVVYSKTDKWVCSPIIATDRVIERYNKVDEDGRRFRETDLRKTGNSDRRQDRPLMWYSFYFNPQNDDLKVRKERDKALIDLGYIEIQPIKPDGSEGRWRWGFQNASDNLDNLVARIMPKYKSENKYTIYEKDYMDKKGDVRTVKEHTSWDRKEFNSDNAMMEFKKLGFSNQLFPFPKSSALIKHMVYLSNFDDGIVLDFFSGSATTADAVMQLNAEDGGKRKFILVQIPEVCADGSEARELGYMNICEIGKERIRRAGQKIKEEAGLTVQNLDTGFRVLKLDSSNMKEVYYTPEEYSQMGFNLEGFMDNIKPDRSDEDLLFQVMLDLGIPLSAKIEQDRKIFKVNENYLIACFDRVDTSLITEIAQKQPYYAVFRDSSFVNDSALVNVEQIFNTYSPSTIRRVL
jgi:adenine-specific DNA-methyltransferase